MPLKTIIFTFVTAILFNNARSIAAPCKRPICEGEAQLQIEKGTTGWEELKCKTDHGAITQWTRCDPAGGLRQESSFRYKKDGTIIKQTKRIFNDKGILTEENILEESGRSIRNIWSPSGVLIKKTQYQGTKVIIPENCDLQCPQDTTPHRQFSENGSHVYCQRKIANGYEQHGPQKSCDQTFQPEMTGYFTHGKMDGEFQYWTKDHQAVTKFLFKAGVLQMPEGQWSVIKIPSANLEIKRPDSAKIAIYEEGSESRFILGNILVFSIQTIAKSANFITDFCRTNFTVDGVDADFDLRCDPADITQKPIDLNGYKGSAVTFYVRKIPHSERNKFSKYAAKELWIFQKPKDVSNNRLYILDKSACSTSPDYTCNILKKLQQSIRILK